MHQALCYPREVVGGLTLPVDQLDHVVYQGIKPRVVYYCPSTGDALSHASYKLAINNAVNRVYPGTDHTPFIFTVLLGAVAVRVGYLSLDCSTRAENAGSPLVCRLSNLCTIVTRMQPDVMFFSEACCKSTTVVSGTNLYLEVKAEVSWLEMRALITLQTGLVFCHEAANSFSRSNDSFGVAVFCKPDFLKSVKSAQAYNLMDCLSGSRQGSGCVVVELTDGTALVGCHFPLDFSTEITENLTGKAMTSLLKLLDTYVTAYGFGDMNTIAGTMSEAVELALRGTKWEMTRGVYTFLAGFYGSTKSTNHFIELTDEVIANM